MRSLSVFTSVCLVLVGLAASSQAAVIFQADSTTVAFEAEDNAVFVNNPTSPSVQWQSKPADSISAGASGGATLYALNNGNPNGTVPPIGDTSTATYTINFSTAGTYNLYYKWIGDAAVQTDNTQANSIWLPTAFGAAPSTNSSSNGVLGPQSTSTFNITRDATTFAVAGPGSLNFTVGTREHAMYIDRFIFSTANIGTLTTGGTSSGDTADINAFNAIANSPVPEPASLGLLAVCGLLFARRRNG